MSAAGRPDEDAPTTSDIAARLQTAGLVRLVAAPQGDALAGAGVLANGLTQLGTPFQLTVASPDQRADRTTDADLTVALGGPGVAAEIAVPGVPRAASHTAFEAVSSIDGADADPLLALAGVTAAGDSPGDLPERAGVERSPGVAVPVADPADGLAHSTLVHAPFSGDREAAAEALASVDREADDADRRIASMVALALLESADTSPRAAHAVERLLRPFEGGPFETVGGYADVLDATAREVPGTAAALVLGADVSEDALSAWRTHGRRAHGALRAATTGRYDQLFVARDDGDVPVGTVARLLRDFRSPEPVALAVTDSRVGVAVTPESGVDANRLLSDTLEDAVVFGHARQATASVDDETAEVIMAVREAL